MIERPGVGEVWWFNDMMLLVLSHHHVESSVHAVVLLDLDEVFAPGATVSWRYDDQPSNEAEEIDRRVL